MYPYVFLSDSVSGSWWRGQWRKFPGKDIVQLNLSWPNILRDRLPDNIDIDVEVPVDETVSRVGDDPPRNSWMLRSPVRWQLRRGLPQHFETADNRILLLKVLPELRLCRPLNVVLNPGDALKHFAQKNIRGAR